MFIWLFNAASQRLMFRAKYMTFFFVKICNSFNYLQIPVCNFPKNVSKNRLVFITLA